VFQVRCEAILIDLRAAVEPRLVDRNDYSFTHQLGRYLWQRAQSGLLAPSARGPGACAPIFRAEALSQVRDVCFLTYRLRSNTATVERSPAPWLSYYFEGNRPPVAFKPETAADAWLGLLAARGIEYLFANGGTDCAPVVEAYAKGRKLGWHLPQIVIVPHENMGVAMAHGYAMVTGRPQAMMVHVGVGTANSLNGLINASRQNVPILFTAGRTPITESGAVPAARNNYIHWAQEHFDQGGMLREFVKWDYELRHAEQVETVLDRALAIAKSEPQGPVYVTLPREILASGFSNQACSETATIVPASPPGPDPEMLEEAAKLLGGAQHPLLVTASGGRTLDSARAIEQLAQMLAVPVVHYRPRHLALSTEHPMHCGWDPHALLKEADVVLVVECDVPWIPREGKPGAQAKVIHVGTDPLFASYPLRGFRADIALTGAVAPTLQALWRAAQKQAVSLRIEERRRFPLFDASVRKPSILRPPASPASGCRLASTSCSTNARSSSTSTRRCSRRW
jgi:thiamine pyrophosphate-dependent acetolactate synthase large subunit-like protein